MVLTFVVAMYRHSTTEALEACEYTWSEAADGGSVGSAEGYGRGHCAVAESTCG